jgi:hypothetical protein
MASALSDGSNESVAFSVSTGTRESPDLWAPQKAANSGNLMATKPEMQSQAQNLPSAQTPGTPLHAYKPHRKAKNSDLVQPHTIAHLLTYDSLPLMSYMCRKVDKEKAPPLLTMMRPYRQARQSCSPCAPSPLLGPGTRGSPH